MDSSREEPEATNGRHEPLSPLANMPYDTRPSCLKRGRHFSRVAKRLAREEHAMRVGFALLVMIAESFTMIARRSFLVLYAPQLHAYR